MTAEENTDDDGPSCLCVLQSRKLASHDPREHNKRLPFPSSSSPCPTHSLTWRQSWVGRENKVLHLSLHTRLTPDCHKIYSAGNCFCNTRSFVAKRVCVCMCPLYSLDPPILQWTRCNELARQSSRENTATAGGHKTCNLDKRRASTC